MPMVASHVVPHSLQYCSSQKLGRGKKEAQSHCAIFRLRVVNSFIEHSKNDIHENHTKMESCRLGSYWKNTSRERQKIVRLKIDKKQSGLHFLAYHENSFPCVKIKESHCEYASADKKLTRSRWKNSRQNILRSMNLNMAKNQK